MGFNPLSSDEVSVLIFAMRYALPRQTTAPGIVAGEIKKHWPKIPPNERDQIKREIVGAVGRGEIGSAMDTLQWGEIIKLPNDG